MGDALLRYNDLYNKIVKKQWAFCIVYVIGPCHHTVKGNNSQCALCLFLFALSQPALSFSFIFFFLSRTPAYSTLSLYTYSTTWRLLGEVLHSTILYLLRSFSRIDTRLYNTYNTRLSIERLYTKTTPSSHYNLFQLLTTLYNQHHVLHICLQGTLWL